MTLRACSGSPGTWSGKAARALLSRSRQGGQAPLDSRLFGVIGVLDFSPCLAGAFRRVDRPPTRFFVKKKFIPTYGAESTTQKASSVLCAGSLVRRREYPARRRELFSLRKSVLRESDSLRGREREVCTDLTPKPFFALKIMGIQGESLPDASFHDAPQSRETLSCGLALRPHRDPE